MHNKRAAQSVWPGGQTVAADVCLHVKSTSKNRAPLELRWRTERECCVVPCELCVGQLLLLAQFTRTAWWLHGTVTPCPHVPISLSLANIMK